MPTNVLFVGCRIAQREQMDLKTFAVKHGMQSLVPCSRDPRKQPLRPESYTSSPKPNLNPMFVAINLVVCGLGSTLGIHAKSEDMMGLRGSPLHAAIEV